MRRLAREESGWTLIELLISSSLLIVVLGATLLTFNAFETNSNANQSQNDSQDRVRNFIDQQARELRNLASPTNQLPQAVDKATSYDLVFQTVDPNGPNGGMNSTNVRRVRYCLDASNPVNGKVWTQSQTWTAPSAPATPSTASCPDAAWGNQRVVAENITNRSSGQDRALWGFNSGLLTGINRIRMDFFVDVNPGRKPAETELRSGVFLRNQNQAPACSFSLSLSGTTTLILDGSASEDPEGDALTYVWYRDDTVKLGQGVTLNAGLVSLAGTGDHTITLHCFDPAGLEGVSAAQVVHL